MTFHWSPLPHLDLDGGAASELALNGVVYGMTLSLVGAVLWLFGLAFLEREKGDRTT